MFYVRGFAEALNQGENVDLDALMADLSSIEQELSTINSKPNSSMARLGLTDTKVHNADSEFSWHLGFQTAF